jgi:hypothetical protein
MYDPSNFGEFRKEMLNMGQQFVTIFHTDDLYLQLTHGINMPMIITVINIKVMTSAACQHFLPAILCVRVEISKQTIPVTDVAKGINKVDNVSFVIFGNRQCGCLIFIMPSE